MSAEPAATVDGRRARRDQNRERVVDALLELYREGDLQPSVAVVAARSGVSHRSVFRYFDDLDELYRVAIERQYSAVSEHMHLPKIGQGTLGARIDRIVEQRLRIYDVAAPVSRAGHMRAPVEPVLMDHQRDIAQLSVEQVARHFAPELSAMGPGQAETVTEAAAAGLAIESIELLRYVRGLDREQCRAAMSATLHGLLGGCS